MSAVVMRRNQTGGGKMALYKPSWGRRRATHAESLAQRALVLGPIHMIVGAGAVVVGIYCLFTGAGGWRALGVMGLGLLAIVFGHWAFRIGRKVTEDDSE